MPSLTRMRARASAVQLTSSCCTFHAQGRAAAALDALQQAIRVHPGYADAHNNLGVLLRDTGDMPESLASYQAALAIEPHNRNAGQNLLLGLNYSAREKQPCLRANPCRNSRGFLRQHSACHLTGACSLERAQNPGESAEVCDAHRAWGVAFAARVTPLPPVVRAPEPDRRPLRVRSCSCPILAHLAASPHRLHEKCP